MHILMKKLPMIVSLLTFPVSIAFAADNVEFTGTLLIPPPCTVFEDKVYVIEYKDIGLHKVDGVNFTKTINYALKCDDNLKGWDLMLTIKGISTDFDKSALETKIKDLGMRITQNGIGFEINKPLKISYGQPPVLEVVPVKRPGTTLPEKQFSAVGTLLAEYQ
ncbi:pilus assembly protein [Providencia rettgeri]|uniref:pilus assembly protein n=1 Tax=Providencia rettgeri TaxID=587 RepID=UPI0034E0B9C5